jgi:hypothetical protein
MSPAARPPGSSHASYQGRRAPRRVMDAITVTGPEAPCNAQFLSEKRFRSSRRGHCLEHGGKPNTFNDLNEFPHAVPRFRSWTVQPRTRGTAGILYASTGYRRTVTDRQCQATRRCRPFQPDTAARQSARALATPIPQSLDISRHIPHLPNTPEVPNQSPTHSKACGHFGNVYSRKLFLVSYSPQFPRNPP